MSSRPSKPSLGARKLGLAQAYVLGRPVLATWQVSRCGGPECGVCESGEPGGDWLSLDDCRNVATRLGRWGSLVVTLVGGADPFLHPDLPGLVAALAERHLPLVTTAGWGVTRVRAQAVWQAGLVEASVRLYSTDPRRHDQQVGVPGSHTRAVEALRVLLAERVHPWQVVELRGLVDGRSPLAETEDLVSFGGSLGLPVTLEPPVIQGERGSGANVARQLVTLKRHQAALRSSVAYLERMDEALGAGVARCQAGRRSLHLDYRGRASRCDEFRARDDQVADLTQGGAEEALRALRETAREDGCRRCWRPSRGEVECLYSWSGALRALPALWRR